MKLRGLDIDDLLVLVMLADGISVTEIGKRLFLTQPAISQRIVKIRRCLELAPTMKINRGLIMTQAGKVLATGALEALIILLRSLPDPLSHGRSNTLVHYVLSKRSDWATDKRYDS